jgi:hypothetical protein
MTRVFRPHNLHITALGLMLIFTGFYAFYGACLVIASTSFPGWANIYLSPTTLGSITMVITMGFAGGFTGGYFASRGDPFWTISGGLAGVIGVSAGADVYARRRVADLDADRRHGRLTSGAGSRRRCASTMPSGRWPCTAARASWGSSGSRLRLRLSDGAEQRREQLRRPDGQRGDVPPARLPVGLVASHISRS